MPNGASSGSSSGSSASHRLIQGGPGCSATLGRVKNLEMTEYQKEKLINEANTVKIKVEKCLQSHIVFYISLVLIWVMKTFLLPNNFRNLKNTHSPWGVIITRLVEHEKKQLYIPRVKNMMIQTQVEEKRRG